MMEKVSTSSCFFFFEMYRLACLSREKLNYFYEEMRDGSECVVIFLS